MDKTKQESLEQYKVKINKRLSQLTPYLQKAAIGDFSQTIKLPDEDDEFTELIVSVNLMIEDLREMKEELEYKNSTLESAKKDLEAENQKKVVKLRENENKYKRLVEGLGPNFFIYSHDTKGVFQYLSPSIVGMLGYSTSEFATHYSKYLTNNPLNKEADKYTALSIKGIKQPPYLVEIYHKNKSIKILEVTETPVKDEKGVVIAVEGVAQDVTENKKAEEVLKIKLEEFEKLNKFLVGRELKMVELKSKLKELEEKVNLKT